ncbi:hypothetical protein [Lysinibacillus xylanilyticus]|uniref:hypothetical protein n=1 Tax=Lysinibacillus xylanilyticus TaxID=582475 RepID=UPI0037F8585E
MVELGIIEKLPSTKLNGIKGASIYRILPYVPSSVYMNEYQVMLFDFMNSLPLADNLKDDYTRLY